MQLMAHRHELRYAPSTNQMVTRLFFIIFAIVGCSSHSQTDHPDSGNTGGSNQGGATSISDCEPGCENICQPDYGCQCVCNNTGGRG
jgi:hypothetical protein